jgi:hypothetical protein
MEKPKWTSQEALHLWIPVCVLFFLAGLYILIHLLFGLSPLQSYFAVEALLDIVFIAVGSLLAVWILYWYVRLKFF